MCDFSESIHSGFLQRAVNQETVVIWWIWVKPSLLDVSFDLLTAYESCPTISLIGIFGFSDFLPKEMTPIAWKIPLRMSKKPLRSPRRFGDTLPPWIMTVIMMTDMLINASVDAFASWRLLASRLKDEMPSYDIVLWKCHGKEKEERKFQGWK